MPYLKKYAYASFILLLHSIPALALPDIKYETDMNNYPLKPEVTPKLSWEKSESQGDKTQYCLTPSDPGCSNMWYNEKVKEFDELIQRYHQKKLNNSHK